MLSFPSHFEKTDCSGNYTEVCFHPVFCPGYRKKSLEWSDIRDPIFRTKPNLHSRRAESIFFWVQTNLPQIRIFPGWSFFPSPFLSEGRVRNKRSPTHEGMDMDTCYCRSATPGNSTLINFLYTLFLSSNVRSFASFLLPSFFLCVSTHFRKASFRT